MNPKTLGQFIEASEFMDSRKADYSGNRYRFSVDPKGRLIAEDLLDAALIAPAPFSDWALQQLCQRMGAPVKLNSLNYPTVQALLKDPDTCEGTSQALTALIGKYRNVLYIRTYEDKVRAVLTSQYTEVSNTQLMQQTVKTLTKFGEEWGTPIDGVNFPLPYRAYQDEDELYLYVRIRSANSDREGYGIGFMVRNSEVGRSALRIMPFVQRTSCENSFVFDQEGAYYAIHRGTGRYLMGEFIVAAGNALKLTTMGLNSMLAAEKVEIPDMDAEIAKLSKEFKWSTEVVAAVGRGTEGKSTLFGLANGVTYAAHQAFPNDAEKRLELELLGGKLVTQPAKVVGRANWVPSYPTR